MCKKNSMTLKFLAKSENESFARLAVASFCANEKFNIEEITDIKTAVSEAVTNSIVHAYPENAGFININCDIFKHCVEISIQDFGIGIENVEEAMKPFFTTKPGDERSGMGFTVMEGFMDKIEVNSKRGEGTQVKFIKNIKGE